MRVGIIGAGKVGVTLGKYLADAAVTVTGFYSRTSESAATAADFVQTTVYNDLKDLTYASDTLFIATPDGAVGEIWDCIAKYNLEDKIICHFSGSLSSHVFSGIEQTGASGLSMHPMYAFSDKFTAYQQFHTAYLVMEGQERAMTAMRALFEERLGHTVLTIRAQDKIKYHAAAAMASNDMIALLETALGLLGECGFSYEDSLAMLRPIVRNNMEAALAMGPVQALTGPVERGDLATVQGHLEALRESAAERIYRELGGVLVDIAKRRHPERNDTAMRNCLCLQEEQE